MYYNMKQRSRLTESDIRRIVKETIETILNESRNNVRRIRITALANMGKNKELIMDRVLMLRHARNVGDEENVNNTVLGALKRNSNMIEFEFVE